MEKQKILLIALIGSILTANSPKDSVLKFHQISAHIEMEGEGLFNFNFYINYPFIPSKKIAAIKEESEVQEKLETAKIINSTPLFGHILDVNNDKKESRKLANMFDIAINNDGIISSLNDIIYKIVFKQEFSWFRGADKNHKTFITYKHLVKTTYLFDVDKNEDMKKLAVLLARYLGRRDIEESQEFEIVISLEYQGLFESQKLRPEVEERVMKDVEYFCADFNNVKFKELKGKSKEVDKESYSLVERMPLRKQFQLTKELLFGN